MAAGGCQSFGRQLRERAARLHGHVPTKRGAMKVPFFCVRTRPRPGQLAASAVSATRSAPPARALSGCARRAKPGEGWRTRCGPKVSSVGAGAKRTNAAERMREDQCQRRGEGSRQPRRGRRTRAKCLWLSPSKRTPAVRLGRHAAAIRAWARGARARVGGALHAVLRGALSATCVTVAAVLLMT